MSFRYGVIIYCWKRAWPFIWTNLNPLHPRMLCAKFGWICLCGSWEEDENVYDKVYDNDAKDNDDGQRTNFYQKSSLEPLAQVSEYGIPSFKIHQINLHRNTAHNLYGLICRCHVHKSAYYISGLWEVSFDETDAFEIDQHSYTKHFSFSMLY